MVCIAAPDPSTPWEECRDAWLNTCGLIIYRSMYAISLGPVHIALYSLDCVGAYCCNDGTGCCSNCCIKYFPTCASETCIERSRFTTGKHVGRSASGSMTKFELFISGMKVMMTHVIAVGYHRTIIGHECCSF